MFLTIDIGGTNMRARVWKEATEGQREECILRKQFSSSPQAHFEIQAFISEHRDKIQQDVSQWLVPFEMAVFN